MKVLVAEDNADSRQLMVDILDSQGYEVLTAPDGVFALETARQEIPDLIILDVNMPRMNGFDVCAKLKANPELASIPVLMLTALGRVEDRVKGLGLGADDYLVKPINPRELLARVDTRMRAKQESDHLRATQQQIRSTFERFVAAEVVEQLLADPDQVSLGGRLQEISVVFADLQGFTTLSERFASTPEKVIGVLNRYLELMVATLKQHGAAIDKYLGDGVMALFNTPLAQPDHALRAVTAAVRTREALPDLYKEYESDFQLRVNFGIHTGRAVVGNIGTAELMNFTAIGDTVNTASRLQGIGKNSQVIVSQAAYDQVKDHVIAHNLGPHYVKGREEAVVAYEVVGIRR